MCMYTSELKTTEDGTWHYYKYNYIVTTKITLQRSRKFVFVSTSRFYTARCNAQHRQCYRKMCVRLSITLRYCMEMTKTKTW